MFQDNKTLKVCFFGYGGQGVKTMANILAKAAIAEDFYSQAFPEFGPERRGAPVKAYARIGNEPILTRSHIEKPDILIFMDESLLNQNEVKSSLADDVNILVNTSEEASEIKKKFGLPIDYHKIHCHDVDSMVKEYQNKIHPSIPMIGKFLQITDFVKLDTIKDVLRKEFLEKIGEDKMEATDRALEESYNGM